MVKPSLAIILVITACGSSPPTGTVDVTGFEPNELIATAIASYAYGGSLNNSIPMITVSFYDHAETSCDGSWVGVDAGGKVVDVMDLTILLPKGQSLKSGATVPLETWESFTGTTTMPASPIATLSFADRGGFVQSSVSGTVTLTRASSDHLTATVDAQMQTGPTPFIQTEPVTVTFDAPACSSLW